MDLLLDVFEGDVPLTPPPKLEPESQTEPNEEQNEYQQTDKEPVVIKKRHLTDGPAVVTRQQSSPPPFHVSSDAEEELQHRRRPRTKRERKTDSRINDAQLHSHIDDGKLLESTFKAALRQISKNVVRIDEATGSERKPKMFSKAAHSDLNYMLLTEVRKLLSGALNVMLNSRRKMLLERDVILAVIDYLNPNKEMWSRQFVRLRDRVLREGIAISAETKQLFCEILRDYN